MIPIFRRLFSSASNPTRGTSNVRPPQPAAGPAPAVTPVRHYFEALNTVDHRTPIPGTGLYVHRLLSKFNRLQLASVARYLWDNVGMVFYVGPDRTRELQDVPCHPRRSPPFSAPRAEAAKFRRIGSILRPALWH